MQSFELIDMEKEDFCIKHFWLGSLELGVPPAEAYILGMCGVYHICK